MSARSSKIRFYSVHVGNLKIGTTKIQISNLFGEAGSVQNVYIPDRFDGTSTSGTTYGFVRYTTLEECDKAVKIFNGWPLNNREMRVNYSNQQPNSAISYDRFETNVNNGTRCVTGIHDNTPKYDERYLSILKDTLKAHKLEDDISFLLEELEEVNYSRVGLFNEATTEPCLHIDFAALNANVAMCKAEESGLTPVTLHHTSQTASTIGRLYSNTSTKSSSCEESSIKPSTVRKQTMVIADSEYGRKCTREEKVTYSPNSDFNNFVAEPLKERASPLGRGQILQKLSSQSPPVGNNSFSFEISKERTSPLGRGAVMKHSTPPKTSNCSPFTDTTRKSVPLGRGALLQQLTEQCKIGKGINSPSVSLGRGKALLKQYQDKSDPNVNNNNNKTNNDIYSRTNDEIFEIDSIKECRIENQVAVVNEDVMSALLKNFDEKKSPKMPSADFSTQQFEDASVLSFKTSRHNSNSNSLKHEIKEITNKMHNGNWQMQNKDGIHTRKKPFVHNRLSRNYAPFMHKKPPRKFIVHMRRHCVPRDHHHYRSPEFGYIKTLKQPKPFV